jgi:hypothetical protein
MTEVKENEVLKYIFSFKNGKAPDDSKVTSEHLKYGGQKLITVLTMLINFIFQNKHIPPILKSWLPWSHSFCPPYLRCSLVTFESSGAFQFLKENIYFKTSFSLTSVSGSLFKFYISK